MAKSRWMLTVRKNLRRLCSFAAMGSAIMMIAGCSFSYRVIAVYRGQDLYFVKEEGSRGTGCLYDFRITSEKGETVWEIDRESYEVPPCESSFPLKYGVEPKGFTVRVAARPLKQGVRYRIQGSDGDHAEGSFSYRIRKIAILNNYPS